MSHDDWRELAERAANEQDPEKLMVLVHELNGALSQREAAQQCRKFEGPDHILRKLNREELR